MSTDSPRIAVLTSGGDSQGMNAAIKAIVRIGIRNKSQVYGIFDGFKGLVQGNSSFQQFHWNQVAHITGQGGTILQTARSEAFYHREGRLKACKNLIQNQINSLIVIGGDGSLTGALVLHQEWSSLVQELISNGEISLSQIPTAQKQLKIIGIAGSIDNDLVGTDSTIGSSTSLHRIIEAIQCIHTTARSHQRSFVVEVMGRKCGWLATMAAVASGADFVFIPEKPVPTNWSDLLSKLIGDKRKTLLDHHLHESSSAIIIVAEGAVDAEGNPVKAEQIRHVLEEKIGMPARVTVLGHMQRGGTTCAHDRYIGTLQGRKAILLALGKCPWKIENCFEEKKKNECHQQLIASSNDNFPILVAMSMNKVICCSLEESIQKTHQINQLYKEGNFSQIFSMRDRSFQRLYRIFQEINPSFISNNSPIAPPSPHLNSSPKRLLIIHTGSPASGMNALTRIACLFGMKKGFEIWGANGGFPGLAKGEITQLRMKDVDHLMGIGGSILGTSRFLFSESPFSQIKSQLSQHRINSILIIGGFEALISCIEMSESSLGIPIICIPATVSNNVPGSEFSIGSDSALNIIVEACDKLKQSATSYRNRVFLLEVQGAKCGYLATLGALGGGASLSHVAEEQISLASLRKDVEYLKERFHQDRKQGRVIVRNECASDTFTSHVTASILQSEAEGAFDVRCCVLGHLQQGGSPSPLDRLYGAEFAVKAIEMLESQSGGPFAAVIGLLDGEICCSDAHSLGKKADWTCRRPKEQWWMWIRELLRQLSGQPIDKEEVNA